MSLEEPQRGFGVSAHMACSICRYSLSHFLETHAFFSSILYLFNSVSNSCYGSM